MQVFDNVTKIVKDDLQLVIKKDSGLSIAAACFSIYAFQALRDQFENMKELSLIFTSPTFVKEKAPR